MNDGSAARRRGRGGESGQQEACGQGAEEVPTITRAAKPPSRRAVAHSSFLFISSTA